MTLSTRSSPAHRDCQSIKVIYHIVAIEVGHPHYYKVLLDVTSVANDYLYNTFGALLLEVLTRLDDLNVWADLHGKIWRASGDIQARLVLKLASDSIRLLLAYQGRKHSREAIIELIFLPVVTCVQCDLLTLQAQSYLRPVAQHCRVRETQVLHRKGPKVLLPIESLI